MFPDEWKKYIGLAVLASSFLSWGLAAYLAFKSGEVPPPYTPPPGVLQSLPPNHTAAMVTDESGRVKLTVAPK